MIVVYPFFPGDQDLALRNAKWMNELGGCKGHECLSIYDARCPNGYIHEELRKAFDNLYTLKASAEINGWPQGANYFFRLATAKLQNKPETPYFFWMEPDAIPLREGWLDAIQDEFEKVAVPAGKFFMGDKVQVQNVPLHMSGVGIYRNPLHAYAGEAYRAADVAWDIAGKDQIVPRAYFTKLIEHAWKHPTFHSDDEITTQIRKEAVIFHSSKDGSLITLLGNRRGRNTSSKLGAQPIKDGKNPIASPAPTTLSGGDFALQRETFTPPTQPLPAAPVSAGSVDSLELHSVSQRSGGQPSCDIFIRTYPGDYPWLEYCLASIGKFCTGFRKIWVVSPVKNTFPIDQLSPTVSFEWKVVNDESPDGYLAQQITKLYADVLTDYQADMILHVDSDVIFTQPTTPQDFFTGLLATKQEQERDNGMKQLPIWPFTPYSVIETPWQPITEKFMGDKVENEFMRRFPIIIPRWLYPRLREFCHKRHGRIISEYIRTQPLRSFSEFNALGAYAYKYHRDKFFWVNTVENPLPPPFAKQFWSKGGLDKVRDEIEQILKGGDASCSADSLKTSTTNTDNSNQNSLTSNAAPTVQPAGAAPKGIKELPNGIWVIEEDTHVSKWVEQQQRLDHDQNLLPFILPHIKEGDTVVDAGAFIGDHTIAYMRKVGASGMVHAIEPNPVAMECLIHNCRPGNLGTLQIGLGEKPGLAPLSGNNGNMGGAYLGDHMQVAEVTIMPLDFYKMSPDFIKLDIEGCEVRALRGMAETIQRSHPTMVIEVNTVALERQGNTKKELYELLCEFGYCKTQILQENCTYESPMYDILCLPENHRRSLNGPAPLKSAEVPCFPTAPPPVTPFTLADMTSAIIKLKEFAAIDTNHRTRVMQNLSKSGLTPKWPKRKKKK